MSNLTKMFGGGGSASIPKPRVVRRPTERDLAEESKLVARQRDRGRRGRRSTILTEGLGADNASSSGNSLGA